MPHLDLAVLLLLALVGVFSPLAAVSSYVTLVRPFDARQRQRLAVGLFLAVAAVAVVTLLAVEPLLELLGLSPGALSATGGIALAIAAVPPLLGRTAAAEDIAPPAAKNGRAGQNGRAWRGVLFVPLTFPLTISGITLAVLVGFRAEARGASGVLALIVAALIFALVAAAALLLTGRSKRARPDSSETGPNERHPNERRRAVVERLTGLVLIAIALMLLTSGLTRLVVAALHYR